MKSVMQSSKSASSSSMGAKLKKTSKDREKRRSQIGYSENNSNDKGSPSKDSKQYAGISLESISVYAEQSAYEHLTKEVCNPLAEDINYKLRYIIHDALLKARLSGRDAITSKDIDDTFKSLSIERIYGATTNPNWVPFGDQNLLYLDDTKINMVEIAEEENTYVQQGNIILSKKWFPEPELSEPSHSLKHYFTTVCQSVISNEEDLRRLALKDISENPHIGPIIEWFYHFGYFLLMKDITYDCLTLSALELIETLENSPLGNTNVSEKQLKLLVRLLLQRLLISNTTKEVLKSMSSVLALLCLREPLKEMVIMKINQKTTSLYHGTVLPILTIVYYLGIEAVQEIFLPNMNYFLTRVLQENEPELLYVALGIYGLLCRANYNYTFLHNGFQEVFGDFLVPFWKPLHFKITDEEKREMNFVNMKSQLIKMRRKVDCNIRKKCERLLLEDVFELPGKDCKVKRKIDEHRKGINYYKRETHLTVGKTSLLLSVLKCNKKTFRKYCDHSLLCYNF